MRPAIVDSLARSLLEASDRGLCILDESGRVIAANAVAVRLLGQPESDLLGRDLRAEFAGTRADDGAIQTFHWPMPGGGAVALRWRFEALATGAENLGLLCIDPLQAVLPGRLSDAVESNFRAILDTITDGVIVIDEFGIIEVLNPAAEAMFGYSREEALGQNVKLFMAPAERERHDQFLEAYRRTGAKRIIGRGRELTGRRKDGHEFPLYLSVGELTLGTRRWFVGITHDLTARKRVENQINLLSRAVDQSPVGIVITDRDGRVEYVNRGFTRLTGFGPEDIIGRRNRLRHARPGEGDRSALIDCLLLSGEEWHGEIQDYKKSGEPYWALETITPIRDASGRVSRYLAIRQDISAQKRDREALQESEERFRQIAEMVGEWLWEQDAEGRYTYCSAAAEQILGYPPEEIVGHHYREFLTEDDRSYWAERQPAVELVNQPFRRLINHYRHRLGHEVFTESTGAPILDEAGRVRAWRGMDVDITARKASEDALRVRDRAIEAANVGIAIADARKPNFPNVYANPALCRITGYSMDELMGRSLSILQGPETSAAAREQIRRALRAGESCEVVLKNYRKDGSTFWNELLLAPVRDETGLLTHYIGIQTDVTERRRAEEERRELEFAKKIQLSLLPKAPLLLPEVSVAGVCIPAAQVGGDYYDFFAHDGHLDLVIADVSGHNVGAALIMAEMRSTLKAELRWNRADVPSVGDIVGTLNEVLFGDLSGAEQFITMFYVRYELTSRRLSYANAGHNPPLLLLRRADGCGQLDSEGMILGVRREVAFEAKSLELEPGDCLLLYTDGMVETRNEAGDEYGIGRLCDSFRRVRGEPPDRLLTLLLDDVRAFRGKDEFDDDISLVVLQIH